MTYYANPCVATNNPEDQDWVIGTPWCDCGSHTGLRVGEKNFGIDIEEEEEEVEGRKIQASTRADPQHRTPQ